MALLMVASVAALVGACGELLAVDDRGFARGPSVAPDADLAPAVVDDAATDAASDLDAGSDADADAAPEFCDTARTVPGTTILDDPLTKNQGLFTAPAGFAAASWSFETSGLLQTRLADVADSIAFNGDAQVGDVVVDVTAASTEISATITPLLRQIFVIVGARDIAGQLSALACGVEIVQGSPVGVKTSVVQLSGTPSNLKTTALQRVDRAELQVDEQFGIVAKLSKGTLTCTVKQAATTVATASNLGAVTGSVGFLTRQTKARFKNGRICKLR